jgi:hypothetical protein
MGLRLSIVGDWIVKIGVPIECSSPDEFGCVLDLKGSGGGAGMGEFREGEYIEGEGGELKPKAEVKALVSLARRSSSVRNFLEGLCPLT